MSAVVLLACALALAPQKAPPPKIQWVPTFEDALDQAKARNAIILLAFHRDGDRKALLQRRGTFENQLFVKKAIEELVCVMGHRGAAKGDEHEPEQVRDPRSGAVVFRCPLYQGITCEQHKSLYSRLHSRYKFKEPPATFLLDPNGEILIGTEGFSPVAFFALKKVKEAQSKLDGKTIGASSYRKILKAFDAAESKLVDEKYLYAIADYKKILKKKHLTPPLKARAEEALKEVVAIGLVLIDKAKLMQADDPEGAMKLLKKVRYEFKGTEAGDKAKELVAKIEEEKK